MNGDVEVAGAFATAEEYADVETFAASSLEVDSGARRLEGAFYGSAGYRALQTMKRAGFQMTTIGNLAKVIWHGVLRRTPVEDSGAGVPFMTTSGMLMARPEPQYFISRLLTDNLDDIIVKENTILVSRSGTVGNTAIVTADFAGVAVSEDALRVHVYESANRAVIYTFFQSEAGQFLLTRNKSGSVVEHLYESDVASLPIPILPKALRHEITRLLDESCLLKVKANRLLKDVQANVQRVCYLPDLPEIKPPNMLDGDGDALVFCDQSADRLPFDSAFGELRLDATYHNPVALELARRVLSSSDGTRLGTVLLDVRNSALRKRVYVDDAELGVPLIGGKQLMQWRPHGVKYLSSALTRNIENEIVENGWTLVSCGGTLGRCLYVHRNFEGYAASQHVMRIIPDSRKVSPGYVFAFLASPYGQVQIEQRSYGSVIAEIRDFQFRSIVIRLPKDGGEAIHHEVVEAFDARADARELEGQAINLFTTAMERGRQYVESEWGAEY